MKNENVVVVNNKIIPELVSGSSTHAVIKQQALKTLKKFQGLSYFITARGFTLIELLVVVLIIGILAAVAVPQYRIAVWSSRLSTVKALTESITQAEEIYFIANGQYTEDISLLDINLPEPESVQLASQGTCYIYPWGKCYLVANSVSRFAKCGINAPNGEMIMYERRYKHDVNSNRRICNANGTNDSTAGTLAQRVCQKETGQRKTGSCAEWNGVPYCNWAYQ